MTANVAGAQDSKVAEAPKPRGLFRGLPGEEFPGYLSGARKWWWSQFHGTKAPSVDYSTDRQVVF